VDQIRTSHIAGHHPVNSSQKMTRMRRDLMKRAHRAAVKTFRKSASQLNHSSIHYRQHSSKPLTSPCITAAGLENSSGTPRPRMSLGRFTTTCGINSMKAGSGSPGSGRLEMNGHQSAKLTVICSRQRPSSTPLHRTGRLGEVWRPNHLPLPRTRHR